MIKRTPEFLSYSIRMAARLVVPVLLLAAQPAAFSQQQFEKFNDRWRWSVFDKEAGVPPGAILGIVESEDGTIWVQTSGGVAWFDQYRWHEVKTEAGGALHSVSYFVPGVRTDIILLRSGRILTGGKAGFSLHPVHLGTDAPQFSSVVPLPDGDMLATLPESVVRISGSTFALIDPIGADEMKLHGLKVGRTRDGQIWLSGLPGRYILRGDRWTRIPVEGGYDIYAAGDKILVSAESVPAEQGAWVLEGDRRTYRVRDNQPGLVRTAALSPAGKGIVVYEDGFVYVELDDGWVRLASPPHQLSNARALLFTSDNDLWVASNDGLHLFRPGEHRWRTLVRRSAGELDPVNAILVRSNGEIWCAKSNAITALLLDGRRTIHAAALDTPLANATALAEGKDGAVWVGSGGGFGGAFRYKGGTWEHFGPDDGLHAPHIHKIHRDRSGNLWFIGLGGQIRHIDAMDEPGVFLLEASRFRSWDPDSGLAGKRMYSFAQTPDGAYWFGSASGLSSWTRGGWRHWTTREGLRENRIFTVAADSSGNVWFGHQSRRAGLGVLRPDGRLEYFDLGHGLPSEQVWEVTVSPDGKVWATTPAGLAALGDHGFVALGSESGLANERLWPVHADTGFVLVGSPGGGLFELSRAGESRPPPIVVIDNPVVDRESVHLHWQPFAFRGEMDSDDIQTRFRLNSGTWSAWGRLNELTLINPESGENTFRVEAKGLFGQVASDPIAARFTVDPPFLESTAFRIFVSSWIGLLVVGSLLYYRQLRHKNRELRDSEQSLQRLIATAGEGIWMLDAGYKTTFVNEEMAGLLGRAPAKMPGTPVQDFLDESGEPHVVQMLDRCVESGTEKQEVRFHKDGGEHLTAIVSASPVTGSNGRHEGWLMMVTDISERVGMEEALLQSEKKYRTIVENSQDLICYLDADNRITFVNPAAERILGIAPEQLIGRSLISIIAPESMDAELAVFQRFQEGGERLVDHQTTVLDKDNRRRYLSINARALRNENGTYLGATGTCTDITERKKAELALRESQAKLNAIFDNIPFDIWVADRRGIYVMQNGTSVALWGDLQGKTPQELDIPPTVLSSWLENRKRAMAGEVVRGEVTYLRNGRKRIFTNIVAPVYADGELSGILGVNIDVTEHRQATETAARFGNILDDSLNEIYIFDRQSLSVQHANRGACRNLGYSLDSIRMMTAPDLLPEWTDDKLQGTLKQLLEGEKTRVQITTVHKRKDGSTYPVESLLQSHETSDEKIIVAIAVDVTDRVRAREVKERLEDQLRHNQRLETIGTLAGGIAHDFNNILVPILGYAGMARDAVQEGSQVHSDMTQVLSAAGRARDLVRQILTFSRQSEHQRQGVYLQDVVEEALQLLRASIPKTIEFRKSFAEDNPMVNADASQILQVVMNLCTNAYQAMQADGGVLSVDVCRQRIGHESMARYPGIRPGEYGCIRVSDTGAGIPEQTLERIFEPFFTTKQVGEGSGLGLSVVHGIVSAHGGEVRVDSEPGKGATFSVFLPVDRAAAERAAQEKFVVPRGTERLLFIDDEEAVAAIGKRMLGRLGYDVVSFTNPLEALDAFTSDPESFDLALTDLTMPEMTGLELAGKLLSVRKNFPIILMTGYSRNVTPESARQLGIRDYIVKPIDAVDLGHCIRRVLEPETTQNKVSDGEHIADR